MAEFFMRKVTASENHAVKGETVWFSDQPGGQVFGFTVADPAHEAVVRLDGYLVKKLHTFSPWDGHEYYVSDPVASEA